tara:strand:+ start:907 stop:1302 length:396 start_codon:yes stop_codon:yes gene_type:complete
MAGDSMRIDKWLWCIRAFRTRSKASAACRANHLQVNGQRIKPASMVRVGDAVSIDYPRYQRTLRVIALLPRRVAAPIAIKHYEDLTPEIECDKLKKHTVAQSVVERERGRGRPTKRERRELEKWLQDFSEG